MKALLVIIVLLLCLPAFAKTDVLEIFAHSGATNSNGCHKDSKTGEYHCHKPKTS
ncbi:MAG: YHYH domain-containing protein [Deferribacteraceae bacterium]|jgi:hypothetical protein|nr:YHYH domain-containing protein [Deferribacteraceae bacterium]